MQLAIDIGGTHLRIGYYDPNHARFLTHTKRSARTITSTADLARAAHEQYTRAGLTGPIERAVIACAGPIEGRHVTLTNSGLTISADEFSEHTHIEDIVLLNDMEAGARHVSRYLTRLHEIHPTLTLEEAKLYRIDDNEHTNTFSPQNAIVVNIGTGCGVALIATDGTHELVVPSEAHALPYTPCDAKGHELIAYLRARHGIEQPCFEDVLSGRGIERTYTFLCGKEKRAEEITADAEFDPAARETIAFFFRYHAYFIAIIGALFLPYRAVILTGNIVAANLARLIESEYHKRIAEYAEVSSLARVPIVVLVEHDINLKGCIA